MNTEKETKRDGRKAPSPESRRRTNQQRQMIVDDEDSVSSAKPPVLVENSTPGRKRISSSTMYQDEEDEFGFLETKPIMSETAQIRKSKTPAGPQDEDILSFGDELLNEEEPRYFKETRGTSRVTPLRAVRPNAEGNEDFQRTDDLRRHFLRRHGSDRKVSDVPSDLVPEKGGMGESFGIIDQEVSPNPPGVNEKIEVFLEEVKKAKPATNSLSFSNAMPNSESLMQAWPGDMERLLRSPKSALTNLDCSLEEYTDIICALFGIPIYDSRIEALHQLFTLFVDFKEIST